MLIPQLSGRQDSNLRPPGPKPGAMTGLRYAPNKAFMFSLTIVLIKYLVSFEGAKIVIFSTSASCSQKKRTFFILEKNTSVKKFRFQELSSFSGESGITFGGLRCTLARTRAGSHPSSLKFLLRRERDSNPRYSYPYVSLANWWFQPLTHPS